MIELVPWTPSLRDDWDALVDSSRNGIFQFHRDYLEYHSDRFEEVSFLAYEKSRCVAVLPGHRDGATGWATHRGLSHGGLVVSPGIGTASIEEVFRLLHANLRDRGFRSARYRPVPWWLHREASQEDLWILERAGARRSGLWLTTLVELPRARIPAKRRRDARRAHELVLGESDDWDPFWAALATRLGERHGVRPVHTVDEIRLLQSRFPDSIRLFSAAEGGTLVAGIVAFLYGDTFHLQYSATTARGRELRALDALVLERIDAISGSFRRLSFGTSCEQAGEILNHGLLDWKEGFAGHGAVYEELSYEIPAGDG